MEVAVSVLASLAASGALTTALVFLAKTWISERVKNAIKHEYDQKLEAFRASNVGSAMRTGGCPSALQTMSTVLK